MNGTWRLECSVYCLPARWFKVEHVNLKHACSKIITCTGIMQQISQGNNAWERLYTTSTANPLWLGMIAAMKENKQGKLLPKRKLIIHVVSGNIYNLDLSFLCSCMCKILWRSIIYIYIWSVGSVRCWTSGNQPAHTVVTTEQLFCPHHESTTSAVCCNQDRLSVHSPATILSTNQYSGSWWALY